MKHVMIVLTLCMLVACGRSQQETSLAWKTDSLVRMSDSTLLIHMVYPVLTDTGSRGRLDQPDGDGSDPFFVR